MTQTPPAPTAGPDRSTQTPVIEAARVMRAVLDAVNAEIDAETQCLEGSARGEFVSPWLDDGLRGAGLPVLAEADR